jgi:hypothetical protein
VSRDDDPEFFPPRASDLPGPAPPPEPGPAPFAQPPAPPLPAAQQAARDDGSRRGVLLKVALIATPAIVVIIVLVVGLIGLSHRFTSHVLSSGTSSSPTPSAPAATTDPPKPTPSATTPPTKPVVAGWQPVVHAKRGVAYDVPRGWEVNSPGTIVGFEGVGASNRTLAMSGSAEYGSGYCTSSGSGVWRAVSGVAAAPKTGDLAAQTTSLAQAWGSVYDEPSKGIHAVADPGRAKLVHVKGARAYHVRVAVTVTGGDACTPHRARVDVLTVRAAHTTGAFVLASEQGATADPTSRTIARILSSVRAYRH